jgi:hypothetical protein
MKTTVAAAVLEPLALANGYANVQDRSRSNKELPHDDQNDLHHLVDELHADGVGELRQCAQWLSGACGHPPLQHGSLIRI